jgi:hypothetical protein
MPLLIACFIQKVTIDNNSLLNASHSNVQKLYD